MGNTVAPPGSDAGIPINTGRPDFKAILETAARETGAHHIGVYAAGESRDAHARSA